MPDLIKERGVWLKKVEAPSGTFLMLDNAYFNQTNPLAFVAAMEAAGAIAAGIYLMNLSAPSATHPPAFAQAILAAGKKVLPIITPSDSTEPTKAQIEAALDSWSLPHSVTTAHDIETYADPPASNLDQTFSGLLADGGYPGMYGNSSFSQYNPGEKWKWYAKYDGTSSLEGYDAHQYTDAFSYGGVSYDVSVVSNTVPIYSTAQPSQQENDDMGKHFLIDDPVANQQHFCYLVPMDNADLTQGSYLYHRYYDGASNAMSSPICVSTAVKSPGVLRDSDGIEVSFSGSYNDSGIFVPAQLHVTGRFQDNSKGTGAHFWLPLPLVAGATEAWNWQYI